MDINPYLSSTSLCVVTVVYCVIFVLGVSGNMLVGLVVWKNVEMRTPTNFFLVNLSIADLLLLLVCMPVALLETWVPYPWLLGRFMCFLQSFNEQVVYQASILTISAISVERYYAICHPLHAKRKLTRHRIFWSIVVIWVFSLSWSTPILTLIDHYEVPINDTNVTVEMCDVIGLTMFGKSYVTTITVVFFVVPLLLLSGLYAVISRRLRDIPSTEQGPDVRKLAQMRSRRQVIHMLVAVVVAFFVCLTPHRVFQMWVLFASAEQFESLDETSFINLSVFIRIMVYLNSTLNPILYTLISSKFQSLLLSTLGCHRARRKSTSFSGISSRRSTTTTSAISLSALKSFPSRVTRSSIRKDLTTRQKFPSRHRSESIELNPDGRPLSATVASRLRDCTHPTSGSSVPSSPL